ncbi:MAG: hypothetical protein ACI8QS_003080, partial [Planctomycetota bacterium]
MRRPSSVKVSIRVLLSVVVICREGSIRVVRLASMR